MNTKVQNQINNFIDGLEQEILSAVLNNNECLQAASIMLQPNDFQNINSQKIYSAIEALFSESKPVNKNTVIDFIKSNEKFRFDNWINYIDQLSNDFYYVNEFKTNVELVKNASIKRNLNVFANKVLSTEIDFAQYADQIQVLQNDFLKIIDSKKNIPLQKMSVITSDYYKKLEKIYENKNELTGTAIGFAPIDNITNGFQPGDLIVLAARPGVGKTALGLNFIYNAARDIRSRNKQDEERVVIFSLEMGKEQLCQRFVSMESLVDSSTLRTGNWTNQQWDQIASALDNIGSLPIAVNDSSDLSILDIQTELKQMRNEFKIKLVVIDYLQLLKGPRIKGAQPNRQQEVAALSRMLKELARTIECPIIAIAQLSRKVEERGTGGKTRRPILSDLRESGAIEQDADLVTFLSRIEIEEDENVNENFTQTEIPIEFTIAKHRNGATGSIELMLYNKFGQFQVISGGKNEK